MGAGPLTRTVDAQAVLRAPVPVVPVGALALREETLAHRNPISPALGANAVGHQGVGGGSNLVQYDLLTRNF